MKLKLISCEVFLREACLAITHTPHTIDPVFTPKGAHESSNSLRQLIQAKIDETASSSGYDAILLGFGLCGNSTEGITARSIPLVIPRAHDCCTIFLGSRTRFHEYFKDDLSAEWSSTGYMERGDSYLRETAVGKQLGIDKTYEEYIELYGEENAKYLWETLHPPKDDKELIFIEIPETSHLGYRLKLEKLADEQNRKLKVLDGDMRLIKALINGEWDEEEFLIVPPGKTIKAMYDNNSIINV